MLWHGKDLLFAGIGVQIVSLFLMLFYGIVVWEGVGLHLLFRKPKGCSNNAVFYNELKDLSRLGYWKKALQCSTVGMCVFMSFVAARVRYPFLC